MSMPGSFSPESRPADSKDPRKQAAESAKASAAAKALTPAASTPSLALRLDESADALSLHRSAEDGPSGRYHDDDDYYYDDHAELRPQPAHDDLPPLYTDDPDGVPDPLMPPGGNSHMSAARLGLVTPFRRDRATGQELYVDRGLDTDPSSLRKHVEAWALSPPRPFVRVRGTHVESVRRSDRTERRTKIDFDVRLELTPFLYGYGNSNGAGDAGEGGGGSGGPTPWRELRVADNFAKVRRGTVFATRAPGFGGASVSDGSGQGGLLEDGRPGLDEWCHRYCASHAGLKTFMLRKEVTGFDEDLVRSKLEDLVRATGYRGRLRVEFPVRDDLVEVYSESRTNRWRLTTWVRWLFYLSLLFLLSWPWLFFRTKRFEVVQAEWAFSRRVPLSEEERRREEEARAQADASQGSQGRGRRKGKPRTTKTEFVSVSEEQWYNMWARAIRKAVLERRQATLDQGDLVAAEGAQGARFEGQSEDTPGAVNGAIRAGVDAMNSVNQHFGWGRDSYGGLEVH